MAMQRLIPQSIWKYLDRNPVETLPETRDMPEGNSLRPMRDALDHLRAAYPMETRKLDADELASIGLPPIGHHGSDEAKIRALGADLVRRRGGEIASRLADLLVKTIQEERRK